MLQKRGFDSNFNSDTESTSDFDNSEIAVGQYPSSRNPFQTRHCTAGC